MSKTYSYFTLIPWLLLVGMIFIAGIWFAQDSESAVLSFQSNSWIFFLMVCLLIYSHALWLRVSQGRENPVDEK
jgi:hypothetical protein